MKPIAIDLFAGAGGFALGFKLAGFEVPLSVEVDAWACDTLQYNHPAMKILQGDIREFNTSLSIQEVCPVRPDVIIGGPPCQGFSIAGPAQKDPTDPRNSLFMNFARWVSFLEPRAFVMENVKGILSRENSEGEKVIEIIKRSFADLGYFVEVWILNAAKYGVPQFRERIFIVGHSKEMKIGQPLPTHSINENEFTLDINLLRPAVSLWDAISDLPELEAGEGTEEQPL